MRGVSLDPPERTPCSTEVWVPSRLIDSPESTNLTSLKPASGIFRRSEDGLRPLSTSLLVRSDVESYSSCYTDSSFPRTMKITSLSAFGILTNRSEHKWIGPPTSLTRVCLHTVPKKLGGLLGCLKPNQNAYAALSPAPPKSKSQLPPEQLRRFQHDDNTPSGCCGLSHEYIFAQTPHAP